MDPTYKVLLIDDSKPVTFFNKVILERSNFFSEIEMAQNGLEALKLLDTGFIPDIIFLDLNMPVMNGWEFLEEYSSIMTKHSPIIVLSGAPLSQPDTTRLDHYNFVKRILAKMLTADTITEIKNDILDT